MISVASHGGVLYLLSGNIFVPEQRSVILYLPESPSRDKGLQVQSVPKRQINSRAVKRAGDSYASAPQTGSLRHHKDMDARNHHGEAPEIARFFYAKRIYPEAILRTDILPTLALFEAPFIMQPRRRGKKVKMPKKVSASVSGTFSAALVQENTTNRILRMSNRQRLRYLDQVIRMPKPRQLSDFLRRYGNHDKDSGDLAVFLRELYLLNLQRVVFQYEDNTASTLLEHLHEAVGKKELLDQLVRSLDNAGKTRFAVEMLFIIEDIFHSQQLTISALQSADQPVASSLERQLIADVRKKYPSQLGRKTFESILKRYAAKRREILLHIIENSPKRYRLADAWFKLGLLDWSTGHSNHEDRRIANALESWQKAQNAMDGENIFGPDISMIVNFIAANNPKNSGFYAQISHIIDSSQMKWLLKKAERERSLLVEKK
ncbi:MAG: hypothetical protein ACOY5B_10525 [Spirochaetota bacterium]